MQQYLALFRNRNFVLVYIGNAISNIGDFFNTVALVKVLSQDPGHLALMLALVMVAKCVPGLVFGPIAGVVADRFSRRTILIVTDLARAVLMAGLVFTDKPVAIIALIALAATAAAFSDPAGSAMIPSIVQPEQFVTANSLFVITGRACQLLGNGIGALVLMAVGAHKVFWIDAASFLFSALLMLPVLLPPLAKSAAQAAAHATSLWGKFSGDIREALAFLRQCAPLRHVLLLLGAIIIGDSAGQVFNVPFYTQTLHLAPEKMGLIWAVFAAASLVGAVVMGAIGSRIHWRHLIVFGILNAWLMKTAAILSPTVGISMIFYTIQGLGSGTLNIGINTAMALLVPDQVRGRIASATGMLQSACFIVGTLIAGFLSQRLPIIPVFLGFVSCYAVAGVYGLITLRGGAEKPVGPAATPAR